MGAARKVQQARFAALGKPYVLVNGDRGPAEVQSFCDIDEAGKNLMRMAVRQMDLSARSYHRVLKLARTIADLAGEERTRCSAWPRRCSIGRGDWFKGCGFGRHLLY